MADNPVASSLGKVLVIGCGKMGEAVLTGILAVNGFKPDDVLVVEPGQERRQFLEDEHGIVTVGSVSEASRCDTVVLAVKPQVLFGVVSDGIAAGVFHDNLVVSVAAGIKTASLEELLDESCSVVRVMPNLPLTCGCGTSAVSGGARATDDQIELVCRLFGAMGTSVRIDESLQDCATAVSGSGPAYFALFVDALAKAGQREGMSYDDACQLALGTMRGTAVLLQSTGQAPADLIKAVSSPGGTTIAALEELTSHDVSQAIDDAVAAARRRSEELSRG